MGARLYQAVISKQDALGPLAGGPAQGELERLLNDELQHVAVVQRALEELGADATAITPSADLVRNGTRGAIAGGHRSAHRPGAVPVMLRIAELIDNEDWIRWSSSPRTSTTSRRPRHFASRKETSDSTWP